MPAAMKRVLAKRRGGTASMPALRADPGGAPDQAKSDEAYPVAPEE